jgi:hypothetical protein
MLDAFDVGDRMRRFIAMRRNDVAAACKGRNVDSATVVVIALNDDSWSHRLAERDVVNL